MNTLEQARKNINEIDKKMAELFCERMDAAKVIGEYKKEHGLDIRDYEREKLVVSKNLEYISNQTLREYYKTFIEEMMSISRAYQNRLLNGMRVAYSGTKGAFAYIASKQLFETSEKVGYPDFLSAYRGVENGECDIAVLPVENSYNGEVGQVTDLMFSGSLFVNNVYEIAVNQALLALPGTKISEIKEVWSHPQALGQCATYLKERGIVGREYANTALAAQQVAKMNCPSIAAIASEEAAEIFGLTILEKNINASRSNTTKFAVFSRAKNFYDADEKDIHTILMFTVRNEAGALAKAIEIIGKYELNMISLRSRPMKELPWQYYFYAEIEGNLNNEKGNSLMADLKNCCKEFKIVGAFKKK